MLGSPYWVTHVSSLVLIPTTFGWGMSGFNHYKPRLLIFQGVSIVAQVKSPTSLGLLPSGHTPHTHWGPVFGGEPSPYLVSARVKSSSLP